jgi:hypothetical protein
MPSGRRPEHPYGSWLRTGSAHSHEQPAQLWDEQRNPCSWSRPDISDPLIAAIVFLEHIDLTGPATHVRAMALRIDKHVIHISAGIEIGNDGVIGRGQHEQSCRAAEYNENSMSLSIERHWEVQAMALDRHGSGDYASNKIEPRDLPRVRHVDEGSCAVLVDLETFGMCLEADVGQLRPALRIDDGECSLAVSDEHPVARPVDPNVVGSRAVVLLFVPWEASGSRRVGRTINCGPPKLSR